MKIDEFYISQEIGEKIRAYILAFFNTEDGSGESRIQKYKLFFEDADRSFKSQQRQEPLYACCRDIIESLDNTIDWYVNREDIVPVAYPSYSSFVFCLFKWESSLEKEYDKLNAAVATGRYLRDVQELAHIHYELIEMIKEIRNITVYTGIPTLYVQLKAALYSHDIEHFIKLFNQVLIKIPYIMYRENVSESVFHTGIQVLLSVLGFNILSECVSVNGRIDSVVATPDTTYIFEFKHDEKGADMSQDAIDQIKKKRYGDFIINSNSYPQNIIAVGVSFNGETRQAFNPLTEKLN